MSSLLCKLLRNNVVCKRHGN